MQSTFEINHTSYFCVVTQSQKFVHKYKLGVRKFGKLWQTCTHVIR